MQQAAPAWTTPPAGLQEPRIADLERTLSHGEALGVNDAWALIREVRRLQGALARHSQPSTPAMEPR